MTFYELERECKKRKEKSIIIFIIILLFILITGLVYFFKNNNSKKQDKTPIKKETIKKQPILKVKPKIIHKTTDKNKSKKLEILQPIINLDISIEKNKTKEEVIKKPEKTTQTKNMETKKKEPKVVLSVQKLPSFDTCIILAENYYKKEDYQNALKWAKNANLQNKNRKISWIIVAKSLYKLNKKEKAIKILKTYYNYTKDKEVLKFIKGIESDKI